LNPTEKKEIVLDPKTMEKLHKELDKKKKKVKDIKATDPRGIIKLSRLPWGFEEPQLKKYFSQFGIVTNIRLARSGKTGNPKGYAWIEFLDPNVAQIVADTMNGYIMFSNILICKVVPSESVNRKKMFHAFTQPPNRTELWAQRFNKRPHPDKSLAGGLKEKNRKLKELGIDYEFPVSKHHEFPVIEQNENQEKKE